MELIEFLTLTENLLFAGSIVSMALCMIFGIKVLLKTIYHPENIKGYTLDFILTGLFGFLTIALYVVFVLVLIL